MPLLKFSVHHPENGETLFQILKGGTFLLRLFTLFKLKMYKKNNNSLALQYEEKKLAIVRVRKSEDVEIVKLMNGYSVFTFDL